MASVFRPDIAPLQIFPTNDSLTRSSQIPTVVIKPFAPEQEVVTPAAVPNPPGFVPQPVGTAPLTMSLSNSVNVDTSQQFGLPVAGATADSFTDFRLPGLQSSFLPKELEAPTTEAPPSIKSLPVDNRPAAASFDAMIAGMQGNALNSVYQSTYHIRFFLAREGDMVTQTGATDISSLNAKMQAIPQVTLAESGVTGFNIKSLEIDTVTQSTARTLYMTPTSLILTVTDPLGSSFLDSFPAAARKLAISDFVKCLYYIEVQFKGYDETGHYVNPAANFSNGGIWTYSAVITNIDAKMNESGGVYTITLVPDNVKGLIDQYNSVNYSPTMTPLRVVGDTLGDLWADYVDKMNKARKDAQGVDKTRNLPLLVIDIVSSPVEKGPPNAQGKDPKTFKLHPQEPGNSSSRSNDLVNGKYSPTLNPQASTQDFILASIKHTEEGQEITKDEVAQGLINTEARSVNARKFRECVLFSVEADSQITGFDEGGTSQNYTRKIVYHVRSRSSQSPIISRAQTEAAKDPAVQRQMIQRLIDNKYLNKRYDFIFTGLNTEVLEFNYDFNFAFQALIPSYAGARQGTDSVSVNATQNPINKTPDAGRSIADIDLSIISGPKDATVDNTGGTPVAATQAATPTNIVNNVTAASLVKANSIGETLLQANSIGASIAARNGIQSSVAATLAALPANIRNTVQANGVVGSTLASLTGGLIGLPTVSIGNSPMAAVNNPQKSGTIAKPKALSEVAQGSQNIFVEDLLAAAASQTSANQDLPILVPFWQSTQPAKIESGKDGFSGQYHRDQSIVGAIYAQEDSTFMTKFNIAEMQIRGDPFWMGQSNLQRQIELRNDAPAASDDLPEWHGGGQLFYLHFRYPSTVGEDFKPVLKDSPIFGGLYTVTFIKNSFMDGIFKQTIKANKELLLDPARITGSSNVNGGAGSSSQMNQAATTLSNLQNLTAGISPSTAVTPTAIQAADTTTIGNLTAGQTAALKASIGAKESNNNPAQGNNGRGFVGQYQTGAAFLADQGYTTAAAAIGAKSDPTLIQQNSSWTGKNGINSLSDYLANPQLQNQVMNTGMQQNYQSLVNQGVITGDTTPNQTAGLLAAAHIAGAPGAANFIKTGANPEDANGTNVASYFTRGANSFK